MNLDGSQMIKGLHYEDTYAPVVQWAIIRFFISLAILSNWYTRQLDFVFTYTQDSHFQTGPLQSKTEKIMFLSLKRTYMVRNKQAEYGIYT